MPIAVSDVETLKEYIQGIMTRAEHHGPNVAGIALALAGAVIWRKDDAPIEVHEGRSMNQGTVLWVRIGGQRYAFGYNHTTDEIEMRLGTVTSSKVLAIRRLLRRWSACFGTCSRLGAGNRKVYAPLYAK